MDGFKPARVWQASPTKNVQNKILGSIQVLVISDDEREKFLKRLFIRGLKHRSQLTEISETSMMKKKVGKVVGEERRRFYIICHIVFYYRLSVFLAKGIAKWHPVPPPLPQQFASQSPLC